MFLMQMVQVKREGFFIYYNVAFAVRGICIIEPYHKNGVGNNGIITITTPPFLRLIAFLEKNIFPTIRCYRII